MLTLENFTVEFNPKLREGKLREGSNLPGQKIQRTCTIANICLTISRSRKNILAQLKYWTSLKRFILQLSGQMIVIYLTINAATSVIVQMRHCCFSSENFISDFSLRL